MDTSLRLHVEEKEHVILLGLLQDFQEAQWQSILADAHRVTSCSSVQPSFPREPH